MKTILLASTIWSISLCAFSLLCGEAWGAGEAYLGVYYATLGSSNVSIENNCRTMQDTMPSGGPYQADSIAFYIDVVGIAASDGSTLTSVVIYEGDKSLVDHEQTDEDFATTGDGYYTTAFTGTKPTLYGDTIYLFGAWADTITSRTLNFRVNATGGSNSTYEDTQLYHTLGGIPEDPLNPSSVGVGGGSYYNVALWYSLKPSSGGFRRRIILQKTTHSLWKEAQDTFAGDYFDVQK